jgi:Concanavalin A-like lectin/glucanases superfamily
MPSLYSYYKSLIASSGTGGSYAKYNGFIKTPPTPPSTLLTGLVSYWNFNQTSGAYTDSVGSNNLGSFNLNGRPAVTPGIIGNAALFDGTQYASLGAPLSPPGSFTIAGWYYTNDWGTFTLPMSQQTANLSFWVLVDAGDIMFKASADNASVTVVSVATPSTGTPHLIAFSYDNTAHTIGISIDGGDSVTTSFVGPVYNSPDPFAFGTCGVCGAEGFVGWIDEQGYWSRILTSDELTELYNNGSGVTYPF